MATKVAVQLIAWGERARSDLKNVLQEVRGAGYDGVETSPVVLEKVSGLSLIHI